MNGTSGTPTTSPPAARHGTALPGGRRALARARLDFWLDAAIFTAYLIVMSFGFTGVAIHEWLGIALGLVLLVHLTLHWDWVIRTTRRMFSRRGRDRLIWIVNLALLICMTLCIMSGILISRVALPELGITPLTGPFWGGLHGTTATLTLLLMAVHVALRWRWILSVGRRMLTWPARRSR